jgi:RHS repeat-associated protein
VARLYPDGAVESTYVYGALAHVPDLVIKNGRTYRLVHDHLGSPRLVVDVETGDIAQRLDYDVHGRVLVDTNPDFQPFGFAGDLHDIDTGLVRFGARDYDPDLARWTAKDPSGFAGNDTNLYAYAYGDPVDFIDPDGELAFLVPLAVLALKGALAGAAMDAGMKLASQLIDNGGNIDCLDWGDALSSGIDGAMSGGLTGPLGKAFTAAKTFRSATRGGSKVGSAGGPGIGKRISGRTADAAEAQADGKCVFCGKDTIRSRTPHPQRRNADHAIPKSRGGNNALDNVQNTCQTCNLQKRDRTTEEFMDDLSNGEALWSE